LQIHRLQQDRAIILAVRHIRRDSRRSISPSERAGGRGDENVFYTGVWEHARETFAPYPKAHLVRGRVPDTLASVPIGRVAYLSIDMNIAFQEKAALEYFWPKLRVRRHRRF